MMVGRASPRPRRRSPTHRRQRDRARGARPDAAKAFLGRELRAAQGRDPRLRRPHGRGRTEVARAIFGADRRTAARSSSAASRSTIRSRATPCASRIGYLSEDRKRFGLAAHAHGRRRQHRAGRPAAFSRFGFVKARAIASTARPRTSDAADQDARRRPRSSRTCPAATSRRSSSRSGSRGTARS